MDADDELQQLDRYYKKLIEQERNEVKKALISKLAFQRQDLERKWSVYFKEAERKLKKAEEQNQELRSRLENLEAKSKTVGKQE